MKKCLIPFLIVLLAIGFYIYKNNDSVQVVAVHHDKYTAEILVDRLPESEKARIEWWLHNKKIIMSHYGIRPIDSGGPDYITIYQFGIGYLPAGKEDLLCFSDIKSERNCIDKNILMTVSRTRAGFERVSFKNSAYIVSRNGTITQNADK